MTQNFDYDLLVIGAGSGGVRAEVSAVVRRNPRRGPSCQPAGARATPHRTAQRGGDAAADRARTPLQDVGHAACTSCRNAAKPNELNEALPGASHGL